MQKSDSAADFASRLVGPEVGAVDTVVAALATAEEACTVLQIIVFVINPRGATDNSQGTHPL